MPKTLAPKSPLLLCMLPPLYPTTAASSSLSSPTKPPSTISRALAYAGNNVVLVVAYIVVTVCYFLVTIAGYYDFGNNVDKVGCPTAGLVPQCSFPAKVGDLPQLLCPCQCNCCIQHIRGSPTRAYEAPTPGSGWAILPTAITMSWNAKGWQLNLW